VVVVHTSPRVAFDQGKRILKLSSTYTIYDLAAMLVQNKFLNSKIPGGHIGMKLELTLLSSQQSTVEEFK
jgi:hypothetical protein